MNACKKKKKKKEDGYYRGVFDLLDMQITLL